MPPSSTSSSLARSSFGTVDDSIVWKQEQGGVNPGFVNPDDPPGSFAYGIGFNSKTGDIPGFLNSSYSGDLKNYVGSAAPGSAAFNAGWQQWAAADPSAAATGQSAYEYQAVHVPNIVAVQKATGIDISQYPGLNAMAFSGSVQRHSGTGGSYTKALIDSVTVASKAVGTTSTSDPSFEIAAIQSLQGLRFTGSHLYGSESASKRSAGEAAAAIQIAQSEKKSSVNSANLSAADAFHGVVPDPSSVSPAAPPFLTPAGPGNDMTDPSSSKSYGIDVSGSGTNTSNKGKSLNSLINLSSTSRACGKNTRLVVGAALGNTYFSNTGMGEAAGGNGQAQASATSGYWTSATDARGNRLYQSQSIDPSSYVPQSGDVLIYGAGAGHPDGHAETVWGGQWYGQGASNVLQNNNSLGRVSDGAYSGVSLFRLTPAGSAAAQAAGVVDPSQLGKADPEALQGSQGGNVNVQGDRGDAAPRVIQNPTASVVATTPTGGMASGMFCIPAEGALLWTFMQEGNPLSPVYFAASYGSNEWASAYQANSQGDGYPGADDNGDIRAQTMMSFGNGFLRSQNTVVAGEESRQTLTLQHCNGAQLNFHPQGSQFYSPNEHLEQIAGNKYSVCLNNERFVQGTDNHVTIGDQYITIGNVCSNTMTAMDDIISQVKQINEKLVTT